MCRLVSSKGVWALEIVGKVTLATAWHLAYIKYKVKSQVAINSSMFILN